MDIEVALDAHAIIGESPAWSPAERALYWIDIKKPALHRYDPLDAEQLRAEPLAGSLLRLRPGERGISRPYTAR